MTELQDKIIQYRKNGAGYKQIARFCNTNRDYVRQVLKKFEIIEKWQPKTKKCGVCGKEYVEKSHGQKYCSKECLLKATTEQRKTAPRLKECKICGKLFMPVHGTTMCSKECQKINRRKNEKRYADKKRVEKSFLPRNEYVAFCPACGKQFTSDRKKKYCSPQCGKKYRGIGRIYILREETRVQEAVENDKTVNLRVLIKRDNNTCAICGGKCDLYDYTVTASGAIICGDTYPTIDHIHPLSKGGSNTWDNVQLACMKCNREKGNLIDG